MAEKDPKNNDGCPPRTRPADVADLPSGGDVPHFTRSAAPTTDFNGDIILDRGLDPSYEKGPPLIKPTRSSLPADRVRAIRDTGTNQTTCR